VTTHVLNMAAAGLLVSVAAPGIVLLLRRVGLEGPRLPGVVALPGFVVLHGAVTLSGGMTAALGGAAELLLLLGALLFWTPVLGSRRMSEGARIVYLFAAMPALDLAGVWLVARGDGPGGIAMVVGMLPMGLIALVLGWRWMTDEERHSVTEP
jgi:hypothetical protein